MILMLVELDCFVIKIGLGLIRLLLVIVFFILGGNNIGDEGLSILI